MKAIILAAGSGSRLRPLTDNRPKTLVDVNGIPILQYIIDSLLFNKIDEIIICTGYRSNQIKTFCKEVYTTNSFTFIENREYDSTNNLYSLYLAREHIYEDFLLMNADLVFEPVIISLLLKSKTSAFCIDEGIWLEESMKVISNKDGVINAISKKIPADISSGVSIDVYKFLSEDCNTLRNAVENAIERDKRINDWTEALLNDLLQASDIYVKSINIAPNKWVEIDDFNDLELANETFIRKKER